MASNFIKSYNVQVNDIISQTGTTPATDLSLLLTSRRGNLQTPGMTLNPIPIDLYRPYLVPSQYTANGSTVLAWAKSIGATVQTGTSGAITLAAPSSVVPVQSGTYVNLVWNSEPIGWSDLVGGGISGTVSQSSGSNTGSIYSVSQSGFTMTLSSTTGTFTTSAPITVTYINTSSPLPNGTKTEQWVLDLYYACEAINLQNTLNLTFNVPSITLSIVSDLDDAFSADPTPIALGTPTSVVTSGLPTGQVLLTWNTAPANWEYVPQTAFGTTIVSQNTGTIFGTILQQMGPQYSTTGTGVSLLLGNVTGVFTAAATSMVLDDTVSTFSLLGNNYYKVVSCGYQITDTTDYDTTYFDFTSYITSVNTQQATSVSQFGTLGVFAQTTTLPTEYQGNVQPNSDNMVCAFYYYPNLIQDAYITAGQVAASFSAVVASNSLPFNTTYGVTLLGLPVCSDNTTYITTGINSEAESLLQYGYSPICVNAGSGQAYMYMPITTQTTIDGVTDQEFYDIRTQQVRTEINGRLAAALKALPFQNGQINPKTIEQAKTAVYSTLKTAESDNLIFNVNAWKNKIVVVQSNINAHQLNISCVIQISPSLTSILITVNVVSSLITPPNTQA